MADAGYGDNPNFLAGLEARQLAYVCGVESNFGMRLPAEVERAAALPGPAQPARGPPRAPRPLPLHTAAELSAGLCEPAWRTVIGREGRKGHLRKQFAASRVHWGPAGSKAGMGTAFALGPRAGCWQSGRCSARRGSPSGTSPTCPSRRR